MHIHALVLCRDLDFFSRWHNLTLIKGMSELEVSHSLSLFLQKLQYTLHSIRTSINASLLDEIFDKICTCIDDIFLQQVIIIIHTSFIFYCLLSLIRLSVVIVSMMMVVHSYIMTCRVCCLHSFLSI